MRRAYEKDPVDFWMIGMMVTVGIGMVLFIVASVITNPQNIIAFLLILVITVVPYIVGKVAFFLFEQRKS